MAAGRWRTGQQGQPRRLLQLWPRLSGRALHHWRRHHRRAADRRAEPARGPLPLGVGEGPRAGASTPCPRRRSRRLVGPVVAGPHCATRHPDIAWRRAGQGRSGAGIHGAVGQPRRGPHRQPPLYQSGRGRGPHRPPDEPRPAAFGGNLRHHLDRRGHADLIGHAAPLGCRAAGEYRGQPDRLGRRPDRCAAEGAWAGAQR